MTRRIVQQLWRATYSRYVAASVFALAIDLGLFGLLHANGCPVGITSAASYSAGIAAHWLASTRLAFSNAVREAGIDRLRQQAMFLLSALVGLTITVTIVALGIRLGIDARVAKLVAIGVSFQATFLLRSRIVFA